jgi:hypothetical protein
MIIPDYENIREERICQECYGYTNGDVQFTSIVSLTNPISIYFKFLGHYTAALSKLALSKSWWPKITP